MTLFNSNIDVTYIVVGGEITYENGAIVRTSFITNMFDDVKIIGDAELLEEFRKLNARKKANLPKYKYPKNITTVSEITYIIERGISLKINKSDTKHCRVLESQKKYKKSIFGSGFLLSEKATAKKATAKKEAAEKDNVIVWELSKKEKEIIQSLG